MAEVGRFVTDPNAGSYCEITLESGEKIIVKHHKWRLAIELSKLLGFRSHRIFICDLDTPEGRTALAEVTRGAHPESDRNAARRLREAPEELRNSRGREGPMHGSRFGTLSGPADVGARRAYVLARTSRRCLAEPR